MTSLICSVQRQIEAMICERARVTHLEHDDLTAYNYGHGLQGRNRERNFRSFYHFFDDVEREFSVIFPISVWDRDWTISNFSRYVEKLIDQPWRSLAEGRKRLKREVALPYIGFYAIGTVGAAALLVLGTVSPIGSSTGAAAMSGTLVAALLTLFGLRKLRRIGRIRKLIGINAERNGLRKSQPLQS